MSKHFFSPWFHRVNLCCSIKQNHGKYIYIYISHVFILTIFRFSVWIQDSFYIIWDNLICVFWKRNQNIFFIKNVNAWNLNSAGIHLFKVNNRNSRTRCEICSKLTIKTYQWWRSSVFIVNLEHISHLVLMFLFLTLSR